MEKETIDYAITKLNEAFQNIKPDAMQLGQDYISYLVFKQTLTASAIGIVFLIAIGTLLYAYTNKFSFDELPNGIVILVAILVSFVSGIGCFIEGGHAIIANAFPLMWTIEELVK